MRSRLLVGLTLIGSVVTLSGCRQGTDSLPPEPVLYPVSGKVTAAGKPLAHAVVTFLQVDEKGTTAVGETDDEGAFDLTYMGSHGAAAAGYKVAISYLVGTDGTVYGLGPRSGLAKPYGMLSAKELVPPEWSDLGRTTHQVTVPEKGGDFDFDIEQPLLPAPTPETPAKGEEKKGTEPTKTGNDVPPDKTPGVSNPSLPASGAKSAKARRDKPGI